MKGGFRNAGPWVCRGGSRVSPGCVSDAPRYQIATLRRPWETWKRIAIALLCANAFLAGIVMAAIHSRL